MKGKCKKCGKENTTIVAKGLCWKCYKEQRGNGTKKKMKNTEKSKKKVMKVEKNCIDCKFDKICKIQVKFIDDVLAVICKYYKEPGE